MKTTRLTLLAAVLAVASPAVRSAYAQDDKVYPIAEVTDKPRFASTSRAAELIQLSYPADLKSRGVGGMVELMFVVDSKGKVDPASVEVVDATQTALGEAARKVVAKLDFQPGKVNGAPVKTKVVLPIIYKPQ